MSYVVVSRRMSIGLKAQGYRNTRREGEVLGMPFRIGNMGFGRGTVDPT